MVEMQNDPVYMRWVGTNVWVWWNVVNCTAPSQPLWFKSVPCQIGGLWVRVPWGDRGIQHMIFTTRVQGQCHSSSTSLSTEAWWLYPHDSLKTPLKFVYIDFPIGLWLNSDFVTSQTWKNMKYLCMIKRTKLIIRCNLFSRSICLSSPQDM